MRISDWLLCPQDSFPLCHFAIFLFFIFIILHFIFDFIYGCSQKAVYTGSRLCACVQVFLNLFLNDCCLRTQVCIALNSWSLHLLMILWNVDNKIQLFCSFILSNVFLNTHFSFLLFILYMFFFTVGLESVPANLWRQIHSHIHTFQFGLM